MDGGAEAGRFVEGAALDRDRLRRARGLVPEPRAAVRAEVETRGGAFVAGIWQFGTFLNEVADGAQSPLGKVRLQFEAPDPRAGVELCADGAATGRRSKSESKMTYDLTRLVPLVCPGTPVDGSVTVDTRVHGMVDGHALDAAVTSNFEGKGTQWIDSTQVVLPLTTDDATGMPETCANLDNVRNAQAENGDFSVVSGFDDPWLPTTGTGTRGAIARPAITPPFARATRRCR